MERVKRFGRNMAGRDIAVGDIHGYWTKLEEGLKTIGFNPTVDRLFCTGDLVDRGPESYDAIKWLNKPWFHSVRGNHDDYVVRYDSKDMEKWITNGGKWFNKIPPHLQSVWAFVFSELPIAIEIEVPKGVVGIVHADCVAHEWSRMVQMLESPANAKERKLIHGACLHSRSRIDLNDTTPVGGIRAVVVGHSPVKAMRQIANVYHIDTTGGAEDGHYTFFDLKTLNVIFHQGAI